MHGNFYEWCADHWHASYVGAPADGSAWIDHDKAAARRVLRGGSWFSAARRVRSASRDHAGPGHRIYIGFRCARVQVASGAEQVAAPADPARRPGAERGRPQGPTGAAALLRVGAAVPCPAPRGGAFLIRSDWEELRFRRFDRPAWASAVGRDKYGLFCTFAVPGTEIIQRMRWIPPGRFRMGSPDDEPDRFADEGPVHEVTLAEGFWLFDTPCTQALWQAVMDRNPSRFESPTRPVEQVSYDDAQSFLTKLNALLPGLSLALPSEAQWEYACRAGTETATYAGKMDILGEHNAPVLDGIAWYGGNSGVDYDLPDGADSSNWPEKAYAHARAGTRPVAGKAANGFGLYDMLGNVMEWCADHWHNSYEGAPVDGSPWIDPDKAAANRVLRGGSWGNAARNVRSACRDASGPAYRYARIGFRCARVQGYSEATAAAEGREEQAPGAERGAATTSPQRARGADSAKRTKRRK
jgi:formylglycine-generating enzyme required for sulfatase activity